MRSEGQGSEEAKILNNFSKTFKTFFIDLILYIVSKHIILYLNVLI